MAMQSWLPNLWDDQKDRDPFRSLKKQMDEIFEDWTRGVPAGLIRQTDGLLAPRIEVSETDKELRVTAELPGVEQKDVEVTLVEDRLTIRGQKRAQADEDVEKEGRRFHRAERSYGSFERTMLVPYEVDPAAVKADFKNGVLTVLLPKSPTAERKTHKIAVKSAA